MTVIPAILTGALARPPRLYTVAGTYVYSAQKGLKVFIVAVGSGGGGASAPTAAVSASAGGGGSSGAISMKWFDRSDLFRNYALIVAAKGAGGTAGGNGTAGNQTSIKAWPGGLTDTSYVSAPGGNGGTAMTASTTVAVAAGGTRSSGPGGDVGVPGEPGMYGIRHSGIAAESGSGGSLWNIMLGVAFSSSGGAGRVTAGIGNNGVGFGAGGGGGLVLNASAAVNGGDGADGAVIIYEFF